MTSQELELLDIERDEADGLIALQKKTIESLQQTIAIQEKSLALQTQTIETWRNLYNGRKK